MAVNVLKQVRKKREVKRKTQTKKKQIEFSWSDPYKIFHNVTLEEVPDAIDAYVNSLHLIKRDVDKYARLFQNPEMTSEAKKQISLTSIQREMDAMNSIKNMIPMVYLLQFLKTLSPKNHPAKALKYFYTKNDKILNVMRKLINDRKVEDIAIPDKRHTQQAPYEIPATYEPVVSSKPTIIQTKYDRNILQSMTLQKVAKLANNEGLSYKGTKRQIINRLLDIPVTHDTNKVERKYGRELLPTCETEYRRAQWMKLFTDKSVVSMLVREDNPYATTFQAKDGWYRATSKFYKDACMNGREFFADEVAYLLKSGDVIVETREIYEESLLPPMGECETEYRRANWIKKFTNKSVVGMLVKSDSPYATSFHIQDGWYRVNSQFYRDACMNGSKFIADNVAYLLQTGEFIVETKEIYDASLVPEVVDNAVATDEILDEIESPISKKPRIIVERKELAPGLFRHVKTIISGLSLCCDTCNVTILRPQYRSIENNKQVVFCGKKCFDEYQFGSSSSSEESDYN